MAVHYSEGDYVIVLSVGQGWPAVVFGHRNGKLPQSIISSAPNGYSMPVLLMGRLEFMWAYPGDLSSFQVEEDVLPILKSGDADLYAAYMSVLDESNPFPELQFWTDALEARRLANGNLKDQGSKCKPEDAFGDLKVPEDLDPSLRRSTMAFPQPTDNDASNSADSDCPSDREASSLSVDDSEEEGHAVDENWVTFVIGTAKKPFTVPRQAVKDRKYFDNIETCEKKLGWTMRRPGYTELDEKSFHYVVDYLYTGTFGKRIAEEGLGKLNLDEKRLLIGQCAETFVIAQEMVMDDLLDYIANRMEVLKPWPLPDILLFARNAITEDAPSIDGDIRLQSQLTEFIVDHYWVYIDEHRSEFQRMMDQYPTLDAAISREQERRAKERLKNE